MEPPGFDKLLEHLENQLSILPDKSEETPYNILKALWLKAADKPVSVTRAESTDLPNLSESKLQLLDTLVAKRLSGIPTAHLTGHQYFFGMEMLAGPEALIPRKETEILTSTAVEILRSGKERNPLVVDVCTGAGNLALAIADSNERSTVYGSDISEAAIDLANRNARHLNLTSRVTFLCGDLIEPFDKSDFYDKVSLITCNPPYISSSKVSEMPAEISAHEPRLAFDGGTFGVNLIGRLIKDAHKFLKRKGYLAFEVGEGQGPTVEKLVDRSNLYSHIATVCDKQNEPRVVVARK